MSPDQLRDKRILVIEDEFLIALDLERTLQRAGAGTVALAGDLEEALDKIRSEAWDAVLTDANLQGRNIGELIEILQQRRIPFLILTGYGPDALPKSAAGAPVLQKPFDPATLVAGLCELCARPR